MTQPSPVSGPYLRTLALALFDTAIEAHNLPPASRRLLHIAADCYAAARRDALARPDRTARDMVLAAPIGGLTFDQQCIVASVVAFQRDKLRRSRELAFIRLSEADQALALQLAAILHLATSLESRGSDEFWIEPDPTAPTLIIGGDDAGQVVAEANSRAERWHRAIGALTVRQVRPDDARIPLMLDGRDEAATLPPLGPTVDMTFSDTLSGSEPASEGARRMLRRMFEKLLAREDGALSGEDPEDVHQMRVATRRLRASLQLVAPLYAEKPVLRFRRGLRRVARVLGSVRDTDVFLLHVYAHRDSLPDVDRAALQPLIDAVEARREQARADLRQLLHSGKYQRFKLAFATFLTSPGADVSGGSATGHPPRIRDVAGSLLWRRYEEWRAFEVALPDADDTALHNARIAGKQLRYALEFFAEALGPKADELLEPLMALQENLGHQQDGVVARAFVADLDMADDPGAQAYLSARVGEHATHRSEFPALWQKVASATYRRRLFEAIGRL